MHATKTLNRILGIVVVAVGLLFAAPVAEAAPGKKDVKASIALGDKRVKHANVKDSAVVSKPKAKKPKAKKKPRKGKAKKSAVTECQNTDVMPTPETLAIVEDAVLCLHNKIRSERGLPLLEENSKLRKAALGHSAAMVSQGFFDHISPDGSEFTDRIIAARYAKRNDAWTLGENLAWGTGEYSTADGMMAAWMASSGHRANILKKAYREIGIGIRTGVPSDEGVGATVTANFGAKL